MDCPELNRHITVAELLTCWREAVPVFLRHRMACAGCLMARFETLESAARNYGLDLESFLSELRRAISIKEAGE